MGSCHRHRSREARHKVAELLRELSLHGGKLSESCPLFPGNDQLLVQEKKKMKVMHRQWQCGECGKMFRSEHYLDLHFERKHQDMLLPNATACLGDYCDMLRCPSWIAEVKRSPHHGDGVCNEHELDGRRHFCQHVMHDCLAGASADDDALFERLDTKYCQVMSCEGRARVRRGLDLNQDHLTEAHAVGTLYYVGAALLLTTLAVLYVGLCFWHRRGAEGRGDLRRRASRRGTGGPLSWFTGKQKAY